MNPERREMIETVQNLGNFWKALAVGDCIAAVRSGEDCDMQKARESLSRHDACNKMAEEVILAIRRLWPEEKAVTT